MIQRCYNHHELDEFLGFLHRQGFKWNDGMSLLSTEIMNHLICNAFHKIRGVVLHVDRELKEVKWEIVGL